MDITLQKKSDAGPESTETLAHHQEAEKVWVLVRQVLAISRPLGLACAVFGLVSLVGYLGHIESLYRPIAGGPATNPLTATSMFLLGLSLAAGGVLLNGWPQRVFVFAALMTTGSRLWDGMFKTTMSSVLTPFLDVVRHELAMGQNNSMGVNTALMLFAISAAIALKSVRKPTCSQAVAFVSLAIPLVSFTGYAYGFKSFYGQMSLLSATGGLFLSLSILSATAHRGALRAVLSPYIGGRIARYQALAGVVVPFLLGFLIVKALVNAGDGNIIGIFVITISWFIISLVCLSAVVQERVDQKRRAAERSLFLTAMTDVLTGLPNRRKFFEVGYREFDRIFRTKGELQVLMIDIDHFKKINDKAGHDMGDKVLVIVGKILKCSIRAVDLAGRVGGEEFAILLPDTPLDGARRAAEKIRQNIEEIEIEGWTDIYGPVTVSIGGASSNQTAQSLEAILSAADEALYAAKESGRNRVVFQT